MKKRVSGLQWFWVLIVTLFILAMVFEAGGLKKHDGESAQNRADLLTIDTMKSFGALERPEVIFFHDKHTESLEKQKKDCNTCHLTDKTNPKKLSRKFKRLEDTSKQGLMDLYHTECIGCHKETAASDVQSGPIEACGECHVDNSKVQSSRQPMGFDKSLHFRHTEAINESNGTDRADCGICHHEYDNEKKELIYTKDKEGSCRYCHKQESEENRISMRLASHLACIDCHSEYVEQKKDAGPINCGGCHDATNQNQIEKVKNVPRLDRKQPDYTIIKTDVENTESRKISTMSPVPFNHIEHEIKNESCVSCHHAELDSCTKCHTTSGAKEGDFINLERAMHQSGYGKSCIGCHQIKQQDPNCAACHDSMEKTRLENASCEQCHVKGEEIPEDPAAQQMMAKRLLDARKLVTETYDNEDIPEKVTIKHIEKDYDPVEVPHLKMINTLLKNISDSKLAGYFHPEKGSICQSCHHNSPVNKKPPSCLSCHGEPFDEKNPLRPGLMGAYHQQCMDCHDILKLEKPKSVNCTGCHKQKKG